MTPWRRADLKILGEALMFTHHGGANVGAVILELLIEVEKLTFDLEMVQSRLRQIDEADRGYE